MKQIDYDQAQQDVYWLNQALFVAEQAQACGEVPVGAILVKNNQLIAQSGNSSIQRHDPTAHAEVIVLREAAKVLKNYRLVDTTLYVTLEPCMMSAGALIHARIKRLVFGAYDKRTGVAGGCFDWLMDDRHLHKIDITGGVLQDQCAALLQSFFSAKR